MPPCRPGRRAAPPPRGAPATASCPRPPPRPPRPGLGAHAAEREPDVSDDAVLDRDGGGDRDERELVGLAVAELEVRRAARDGRAGHLEADDELAVLQRMLEVWRVAGEEEEVVDRDRAIAGRADRVDEGV